LLKNIASLVIGQHLVFDGEGYQVELTAAETKSGRPYVAAVPHELTPYIERWLQVYRRMPLTAAGTPATVYIEKHLWINRSGQAHEQPCDSRADQAAHQASLRQGDLAAPVPRLCRDQLVDFAPEEIGIAPDLLGHARLQITQKHYIQAVEMKAHGRVQEVIAQRRAAAALDA
jgi:integrase/recombinase XerD